MKPVPIILSPKIRPAAPPTSAINDVLGYVGVSLSTASVSSTNESIISKYHTLYLTISTLTGKCKYRI